MTTQERAPADDLARLLRCSPKRWGSFAPQDPSARVVDLHLEGEGAPRRFPLSPHAEVWVRGLRPRLLR